MKKLYLKKAASLFCCFLINTAHFFLHVKNCIYNFLPRSKYLLKDFKVRNGVSRISSIGRGSIQSSPPPHIFFENV